MEPPSTFTAWSRSRAAGPSPELLLAVAEIGRELASNDDEATRLSNALRVLEVRLGVARAVLYAADTERRVLSVKTTHGIARDQFRARFSVGLGVAGRVAATGRPFVVPVVRHDPMALCELADPTRWNDARWSLIAVAARVWGRRIGVLCAYFRDAEDFAERQSALEVAASLMCQGSRAPRAPRAYVAAQDEAPIGDGFVVQEHQLPATLRVTATPSAPQLTLAEAVERLERQMIEDALRSEGGSFAAVARILGTTERIVRYKARNLGIQATRFRR